MQEEPYDYNDGRCNLIDIRLCPDGVVYFGRCFTFVSEEKDWLKAEAHCQNLAPGSHLASMHCKKQFDIITSSVSKVDGKIKYFWIGLNDMKKEGTYVWVDGSPTDFTKWQKNEPNNAGNEDCVYIQGKGKAGWNDVRCELQYPFVCSHKVPCD
ncbi:lectin-like [Scyliorhinus canicula]|uniref:lectin-like n=1 Tax=Scyliorhinus canicula TaxID=7830 RepID=UPI0018F7C752|nr:lectin-like [Scyliorhinus canicula]XP_038667998.1 lectin-like [Scyliorhinus canicula]